MTNHPVKAQEEVGFSVYNFLLPTSTYHYQSGIVHQTAVEEAKRLHPPTGCDWDLQSKELVTSTATAPPVQVRSNGTIPEK